MIAIRNEKFEDYADVYQVNELAFGRKDEANLIERLRAVEPRVSLVAVRNGKIVGHIFFSEVMLEPEGKNLKAAGLAPMAVLPEFQNQGIGSKLVKHGLKACENQGFEIVVVLGHPAFYPRFGFETAKKKGITCEYPVPDEAFIILELEPGILAGKIGRIKYRPEFADV